MLQVLYRDDHLVAVHKPSGLLVHRTGLDRHAQRFALQLLRDQIGRTVHPVHRLDRGTSGVLLFGLDAQAARAASLLFEARRVHKRYLAVVRGWPPERGEIDHPLARARDEGLPAISPRPPGQADAGPQPALTRYRRLAMAELPHGNDRYPTSRYALLALEPVTGRRHQIRRHLKHIAHPVIGDATYGKGAHNRLFRTLFGCPRLLLACVELRLPHPLTGEALVLQAPPAEDFAAVLRALGWQDLAAVPPSA